MSTQTPVKIKEMIEKLRALLGQRTGHDIELGIADDGYLEEGGWVYLIVTPSNSGVRAHQYVDLLNDIEQELRKDVGEHVLLVPAAPD